MRLCERKVSRKGAKCAKQKIHSPLAFYKDLFAALFSKIPSLLSLFHSERYNATESCKVLQDKRDLCALCALA